VILVYNACGFYFEAGPATLTFRYTTMTNFLIPLCVIALVIGSTHKRALADFAFNQEITLGTEVFTPYGIAFDGTNWHISDASAFSNQFGTYDTDFNLIGTTPVAGFENFRGLTYEAYNNQDDTLWLSTFGGTIQNRTRTGQLISSFNTGVLNDWTGLAFDELNNSLLLLTSDDSVYEYGTDGTLIGQPLASDIVQGNGLGLAYDSSIGRLYVTSQLDNSVTVFDDPNRVPEPSSVFLLLLISAVAMPRRR